MTTRLQEIVAREMEWEHNARLQQIGLAHENCVRLNPDDARLLEVAARALCIADGIEPDKTFAYSDTERRPLWRTREVQARAVLAALAEAVSS